MLNEVSPPGWSGSVKAMKKHKEITNPFALAWWMKKRGAKPHHKPEKMRFKEFFNFIEGVNLDYVNALKVVFNALKLPPPQGDRSDIEPMLSATLGGYGKEAMDTLMKEPSITGLPNFQSEIVPAIANKETTVGRLVSLMSKNKQSARDTTEPDEYTPEPNNNNGVF